MITRTRIRFREGCPVPAIAGESVRAAKMARTDFPRQCGCEYVFRPSAAWLRSRAELFRPGILPYLLGGHRVYVCSCRVEEIR